MSLTAVATDGQAGATPTVPWRAGLLLLLLTGVLYGQTARFDFVDFDDGVHVFENPHVRNGLSFDNVVWAFGIHGPSQWHPLAWLSHQWDCQLFGLHPAGHHLMNVAFHGIAAVLLFFALRELTTGTGTTGTGLTDGNAGAIASGAGIAACWYVAALFAVHPLNVESVAWVSERRNVLCAVFWMATLWSYGRYARTGGAGRYLVVVGCFVLALMSKPLAVTLPCVLLLLDVWPLRRTVLLAAEPAGATSDRNVDDTASTQISDQGPRLPTTTWLIAEKVPLLMLSIAASVLTVRCQQAAGVVGTLHQFPLLLRVENAAVAAVWYVRKMFWPTDLAAFYPHPAVVADDPGSVLTMPAIVSAIVLLVITGVCLRRFGDADCSETEAGPPLRSVGRGEVQNRPRRGCDADCSEAEAGPPLWSAGRGEVQNRPRRGRREPVLLVGWLWFLGTLLPMIGIVQVGEQQMADRYAYIPLIGLFLAIVFGGRLGGVSSRTRRAVYFIAAGVLAVLALLTWKQVGYWRDSVTLFTRATQVTERNHWAHNNLGYALYRQGDHRNAAVQYATALSYVPDYPLAQFNLGVVYHDTGYLDAAEERFRTAIALQPEFVSARVRLSAILVARGRVEEAIAQLEASLAIAPDYASARFNLGLIRQTQGRREEAISLFRRVLELDPAHNAARAALDRLLAEAG